jgi:hypothetical protein
MEQAKFAARLFVRTFGLALLIGVGIALCATVFGCSDANFDVASSGEAPDGLGAGDAGNVGNVADSNAQSEVDFKKETGAQEESGSGASDTDLSAVDTGSNVTDTGVAAVDTGVAATDSGTPVVCDFDGDGNLGPACGGLDCDDKDGNVHHWATAFFATASTGVGTWDYNCNDAIEKESAATSAYAVNWPANKCDVTQGWSGGVPECGKAGKWLVSVSYTSSAADPCKPTYETRTMKCR